MIFFFWKNNFIYTTWAERLIERRGLGTAGGQLLPGKQFCGQTGLTCVSSATPGRDAVAPGRYLPDWWAMLLTVLGFSRSCPTQVPPSCPLLPLAGMCPGRQHLQDAGETRVGELRSCSQGICFVARKIQRDTLLGTGDTEQ